ncbi:MAG: 6,7-dimethyl-8-ribityllumazine synthase [Candidatus Abyssobacteria bacterium SURF_17]|jgi:6,7-dimethyl-8-ribityllumazine synthase|uniref:6,7-dimethyl-8-ribityllumazine synthase n=1 Tax=Candidatus Abyssobacteria bacterium SURF_17 TaxID=2093361 RepID=A0A419EVP3_9BACT|nr:MAG: 6,7-dimethyl-8-ribityllumazine synthase [Candidatus Abyssubacteria bacterium SURF_17]
MPKVYEGQLIAKGKRFGIVASRFNEFITNKLLEGALDALKRHGAKDEEIEIAWVPGSFEIPYAAQRMAASKKYDAIICVGAVIRGSTPHFEYIASEVTKGIAQTGLNTGVPVIYGVITPDTLEQAIERAGTKAGNKGFQAAMSAIEMVNLFDKI